VGRGGAAGPGGQGGHATLRPLGSASWRCTTCLIQYIAS
jgi:hypothetical protein